MQFCYASFSQVAADGLRKHCKTVLIQCTEHFEILGVQNLVQNQKKFHIPFTPREHRKRTKNKTSFLQEI